MAACHQANSTHVGAEPMASSVATSMDTEAFNASKKFEEEFYFSKMETMIHRFPPGLGEIISSSYSYMVVPRFVAIGPYHHGKKHLVKMEAVKKAAAHYLWQHSHNIKKAVKKAAAHYKQRSEKLALDDATREVVVDAVDEAHGLYLKDAMDGTVTETEQAGMMKMKDDAQFADMMLCDACFLLLYMHAYTRSYGKDEDAVHDVNESMRRFLFCNRDRINNDIMLLENQLPWRVIQVLIDLASDLKLKETVGYFIAAMGSSFKIRESSKLKPYVWDDKKHPPPHLLALLRSHKTEEQPYVSSDDNAQNNNSHPPPSPPSIPHLHHPLIHQQAPTPPQSRSTSTSTSSNHAGKHQEVVVSAISPMDLEQIGITLAASKTEKLSDMGLEKGLLKGLLLFLTRLTLSRLTLAPLSLSDTRRSWLVNMAAFEVCTASRFGDPADRTAVCSYLKLLAFFMVGGEDVRKLRSKGLLNGPNTDDDMLAFFQALNRHLPGSGTHFSLLMKDIEEYKRKRWIMTALYKWVYKYWKTVGTVLSIILAVVTAIAAIIRLYQALLSLIHNN